MEMECSKQRESDQHTIVAWLKIDKSVEDKTQCCPKIVTVCFLLFYHPTLTTGLIIWTKFFYV